MHENLLTFTDEITRISTSAGGNHHRLGWQKKPGGMMGSTSPPGLKKIPIA